MDASRFDALSRFFSDGTSRRRMMRLLGGLTLGGAFTALPFVDVLAKKKHKKKKKCKKSQRKCGKKCLPATSCCTTADCDNCETCQGGACVANACCPECPGDQVCLDNGSCAQACSGETCPTDCNCSFDTTEGANNCVQSGGTCEAFPQVCTSTAECATGQQCQQTTCGSGGSFENRCWPLCTA